MQTEHRFLTIDPDDYDAGPHRLDGLTLADLKIIYNALLLDTVSDGERTLGPLELLEKLQGMIKEIDGTK